MATVDDRGFRLALATARCWKCSCVTRVGALVASADAEVWDDDIDELHPQPERARQAIMLSGVTRITPALEAAIRATLPTFRLDTSKTANTQYWMNHCSACGRSTGDWFVQMEPDGPFFAWPRQEVEVELLDLVGGSVECSAPILEP
jgi:hypothetical protein